MTEALKCRLKCMCPLQRIVICAKWGLCHHGFSTFSFQAGGGLRLFESLEVGTEMGLGCPTAVGSDTKSELKVKANSGPKESDPIRGLKPGFKAVFHWALHRGLPNVFQLCFDY